MDAACCVHRALTCHRAMARIQGENVAKLRMCTLLLRCEHVKATDGALQSSASLQLNICWYISAAGSNMRAAIMLLLRKVLCTATSAPFVCNPTKQTKSWHAEPDAAHATSALARQQGTREQTMVTKAGIT